MSELSPNTANLSTNITVTPASNTVSPKTQPLPHLNYNIIPSMAIVITEEEAA